MQSTETFSFLAYQVGFRYFDLPYAAAISWFILAINLIISLIFLKKMYIVEER
jgi:ABC-type sugar transport system permease subunit